MKHKQEEALVVSCTPMIVARGVLLGSPLAMEVVVLSVAGLRV